jgi:hypothetical protein
MRSGSESCLVQHAPDHGPLLTATCEMTGTMLIAEQLDRAHPKIQSKSVVSAILPLFSTSLFKLVANVIKKYRPPGPI